MRAGSLIEEIDLSNFDTSSVTNMSYMFSGAGGTVKDGILDSNMTKHVKGIEDWDLSSIINIEEMFKYSPNPDIPNIYKHGEIKDT